ncbi:2,4-dihydroxyhept-2-ene-1,7-dioic acid aldolase [Vibrio variabilis]|uniref:2,4-dihydroxyhept-2-ene-1,7-dioic acid aldolase n=1 Tax=Vibrio variabilis TaxID=990271 RepID=A0ABQ0JQ16_9VIBR|nr:2,4-dihydroxyhept-2-ene-1,7-dioic acid aldolase [Vibrio variabilis]
MGILSLNPTQAKDYAERGVTFIGAGVDTLLLRLSAEQLAYKLKHVDDIETPVIDNVY